MKKCIVGVFLAGVMALSPLSAYAETIGNVVPEEKSDSQTGSAFSEANTRTPGEASDPTETGFVTDETGLRYYEYDAETATGAYVSGLFTDNSGETVKTYYFDPENSNYAVTGFYAYKAEGSSSSDYYYFCPDAGDDFAAAVTNTLETVNISGKDYYYYFGADGKAYKAGIKGVKTGGTTDYYYFTSNGRAYTAGYLRTKTATAKKDSKGNTVYVYNYYYFGADGKAYTTGLKTLTISGKKYKFYFGSNGKALKNKLKTVTINKKNYTFYFGADGRAITNSWKTVSGKKYYFNGNGYAVTGRVKLGGKYYYLSSDGNKIGGWHSTSGKWYYYDKNTGVQKFANNNLHAAYLKIKNKPSQTNYYIVVDTKNCLTMIFQGKKGSWVPIKCWSCGPGKPSTPSIKGYYTVGAKGYCFGTSAYTCYYYTQIKGNYLFHSVLYYAGTRNVKDPTLGKQVSHGCIRLDIDNAYWIYKNIPTGSRIYSY